MEISIKTITIFGTVVLTGLSAGLFYAWAVSVIPGTRKVSDLVYLETMQSINRAIINPAFILSFFGALILLVISTVQQYHTGMIFWILLIATTTYLIGTIGVTAFGNVPLNNALDVIDLSKLNIDQLSKFRLDYELKWNRLHMIRTLFSFLSFLLSLLAVFKF